MSLQNFDYTPNASITTKDGVTLRYLSTGSGPVLLLLHGWSQSAAQWAKQISEFSKTHRVIALDQRGHGESDKPEYGYRISRLATDLHEFITQLNLSDITAVGHSMGCSVLWCYIDLFPSNLISKLVLVDQAVTIAIDPSLSESRAKELGGIMTPNDIFNFAAAMQTPEGDAASEQLVASMKTSSMSEEDFKFTMQQNLKMPRKFAAELLLSHAFIDWSDVLPRIKVPTFVIGGAVSAMPPNVADSIASKIPGAKAYVFSEAEKGSHFMFWENADMFNTLVLKFLQE
jgi:pimeloyl-ACP methyl ester carboxylesterase